MEDKEIINIILMLLSGMLFLVVILLIIMKQSQMKVNEEKFQRQELIIKHKSELLSYSLKGQEKERSRLSVELHDGIVSKLNIINLKMGSLEMELGKESGISFHPIHELLKTTIEDTRRMSHELMPVVLENFGVITALEEMKEMGSSPTLSISLKTNLSDADIDDEDSIHLYRITQELVNNSIKHAQCSAIDIHLWGDKVQIQLELKDNGLGAVAKLNEKSGLGLRNIQSRLLFLNASMEMQDQNPGLGFKISFPKKER
ncbi:sensor histidine kinase [Croceimicrobium hydrocarbonivorans]|uniref:histidine kinase n=1 Tax=Croceimicrobium hydrocarbonivorans TaxID=2761580 RepID=A0A7H0VFQ3_9FLAO|nr:ATP-binding protein [Croceimicrobium hydrocarbonivorans]QNR24551.1 hypothetical protein H4K34_01540 [Croceimicrobium hydrocarbonivorans]